MNFNKGFIVFSKIFTIIATLILLIYSSQSFLGSEAQFLLLSVTFAISWILIIHSIFQDFNKTNLKIDLRIYILGFTGMFICLIWSLNYSEATVVTVYTAVICMAIVVKLYLLYRTKVAKK